MTPFQFDVCVFRTNFKQDTRKVVVDNEKKSESKESI